MTGVERRCPPGVTAAASRSWPSCDRPPASSPPTGHLHWGAPLAAPARAPPPFPWNCRAGAGHGRRRGLAPVDAPQALHRSLRRGLKSAYLGGLHCRVSTAVGTNVGLPSAGMLRMW